MFTGIVEELGVVRSLTTVENGVALSVAATTVLDGLGLGDSVAIDGTCLTVTALDPAGFIVGLSPETLRLTALGSLTAGRRVNLERALRAGDRFGGHFVQGHVDGVGVIRGIEPDGDALAVTFSYPPEMGRYIVHKGFITVSGTSLTITQRTDNTFSVALVAYTQEHVALLDAGVGGQVNLEVDVIAKYVESMLAARSGTQYDPKPN